MGQLTIFDFIGISANTLTIGVAIGLLFGVLVQPRRERANWWFAAFLVALAGWSYSGILNSIPGMQQFVPAQLDLNLYISGLGLTPVLFFLAAVSFCQIETSLTRAVTLFTIPAVTVGLLALWAGELYVVDFAALPQSASFSVILDTLVLTPAGTATLATAAAYLLVTLLVLVRTPGARSHALILPALLMLLGMTANAFPMLNHLPIDTVLTALAAVLMGHTILKQQLLEPFSEMNTRLNAANQELRTLVAELSAEEQRTTRLNNDLLVANQYRGEFMTTMSHELRTPLNAIVGYSELLIQGMYGDLNERQQDRITKILRNGRDLLALINDILDLTRLDSQQMTLLQEDMAAGSLITAAVEDARPAAEARGLALHHSVSEGLPGIYADPLRIRQILDNLLDNAIKFTAQGEVRVTARRIDVRGGASPDVKLQAKVRLQDGPWLLIEVADTGIGIAPEHHAQIFDEFRQTDGSATREFGGTGLGLAIARKLVELHQGRIWLESALQRGSTFYVALPASKRATPLSYAPTAEAPVAEAAAAPVHVLCIDDSQEALDILTTTLEDAGYRVTRASSGQAGLEMARMLHPDLITTDLMMSGLTGWDLIDQLRATPDTAHIPVIIVSIVDQQPVGYEPAAAAHISKPVDQAELLAAITRLTRPRTEARPILVVDDDSRTCQLMADLLTGAGHSVVTCTGGAEALSWLHGNRPRLVLLDLLMPGMSGFDVLEHIRGDAALADLPVLVVTAKELTLEEREALQRHLVTMIRKQGLQRSNLLEMIAQATT